jgi:hypothetical protein
MIYFKYTVKRKAYIGGKLYYQGDVLDHQKGFEVRKSLMGIGEPFMSEEAKQMIANLTNTKKTENEEESNTDEIKRGAPGKWKLPDGEMFTGKLAEAKEYWELCKIK